MLFRLRILFIFFTVPFLGIGQKIAIKDTIYITQCDTGTQGKMLLDLEAIKNGVFSKNQEAISPTIFIATQGGSVIKIENILTTLTIKDVCLNLSQNWTDIAINKDKEIYLCSNSAIYKLDTTTCTITLFNQVNPGSSIYALSFDTKNNLYYSDGSAVYRFNNTTGTPVLWHDFGSGYASGDFVMKNGKMYISWVMGSSVRLYEVTVDNNINYVSHIDKCNLKLKTYGLASELGELYGVTPTELYRIDDNLCQNTTLKTNNGYSWYGAAGLHEAQNSITAHLNYSEAINISNSIKGNWTNTIPFNQIIYLTIDDKIKDSLYIYPVKIKIKPKAFVTINKTICKGTSYEGYNTTGTYINQFKDKNGCDSTRTLNLRVVNNIRDTLKVSICQGQTYRTYNATGTYVENFKTVDGCDSILLIELKVNNPSSFRLDKTICRGKIFKGKTTSGTYTFTYLNSVGCDSVLTVVLTVVDIVKPFIDIYSCIIPGQSYPFLSLTISGPGSYIDTTNYVENCDTIFRLNVSLVYPLRDTISVTKCQGYIFKNVFLINDTSLMDTLRSYLGCDSIYILNKIIVQKYLIKNPIQIFYCDSFILNNQVYKSDTFIYENTKYIQAPFCDSLIQKNVYSRAPKPIVNIDTPQGAYCIRGEMISIIAKGASRYLWSTSETNSKLTLKPNITSTYPVTIDVPKAFSPNGDGLNDIWSINSNGNYQILNLQVFDRWGEKVFSASISNPSWNGVYKNAPLPAGVYSYLLSVKKNRQIYEKTGEVILVK
jgi:gliding motility-associated-like protein